MTPIFGRQSNQPGLNSYADVWITVEPSPLVARILGGDRTVSQLGTVTFRSGSYDPDDDSSTLEYMWECRAAVDNTICGSASSATWAFQPNALAAGTYIIELMVSDGNNRQADTQVLLSVVDYDTLDIEILVNSTVYHKYGVVSYTLSCHLISCKTSW